jgi:metal-responsive CopG/Arc/MetJ family transcriptional regulator
MRTSISIDDGVAELAEGIRKKEGRPSFSNVVEVALTEYCSARGGHDHSAEIAEAAKDLGHENALKLLTAARRKTRKHVRRAA